MKKEKLKIFLADDHPVFRDGVRMILESELHLEVVGEATTGDEVLARLQDLELDVLLLDINMPGINGLDLIKQLSLHHSQTPVLVFSSFDDEEYVYHMIKNGAKGYLLKSCPKDELIQAIQKVIMGETYLCTKVSNKFFQYIEQKEKDAHKISNSPLTKREIEILKLVATGLTNQEIGQQLFISHRTVDTHRRNMMVKLDLHNAAALTNYAAKKGYLKKDELR